MKYRREVADSMGLGFELLPEKTIVRNVGRKSVKRKSQLPRRLMTGEGLKWRAQGDDFRTFLAEFMSALPQAEIASGPDRMSCDH
jgi:hypothetical protein